MYWFISASVGIAAKTMASCRHGFDILTGPEIPHLFHMAIFRPGCFKLELRELRSVVYHPQFQIAVLPKSVPAPAQYSAAFRSPWHANAILLRKSYPIWTVIYFSRCISSLLVSQQVSGLSPARTDAPQRVRLCRLAAVSKCVSI